VVYWQELIGEADVQIDLLFESVDNIPSKGVEGHKLMGQPLVNSNNINAQNQTATNNFVKNRYPDEKFVSDVSQLKNKNKYTKGLVIPEGVKVAESRMPRSTKQRETLRKELRQASILAEKGNSVYLIPEHGAYGETFKDAVVNGTLYEFREIKGNARTLEWEFGDAKEKKGNDTNMFLSIESNISKNEARRRIGLVLERHPEYTGKIVVSFNAFTAAEKIYSWDTTDLR
jgi:hypothetical protein